MARITQDDSSGQAGSKTGLHLDALDGSKLDLPGNEFVTDAKILRDGQDLILRTEDGQEVVINNYFLAEPSPVLTSTDGAALTPELVNSFVRPADGVQFAQKGSLDDESPVGMVREVSGDATITRADGTVDKISEGTPVYQGDIVETRGDGAVNITFVDETTFAVSENARLAIDEYVFDPATQSGETNFSVLRGVFVFTSGLIGREDPDDVKIETPVGSIGIRGTTIMGDIDPDGESTITVVEGAIVVTNGAGEQTLSQEYETVRLTSYDAEAENVGVLSAEQIGETYNVLRTVSGTEFSTVDDNASEPAPDEAPAETSAEPAPDSDETGGVQEDQPATETQDGEDQTLLEQESTSTEETIVETAEVNGLTDTGFDTTMGFDDGSVFKDTTVLSMTTTTNAEQLPPPPPPPTGTYTVTDSGTTTTGTYTDTTTDAAILPPVAVEAFGGFIDDTTAITGQIVLVLRMTSGYPQGQFGWDGYIPVDSSNNPLFYIEQTSSNEAVVRLTSAGVAEYEPGDYEFLTFQVTLPDGRVGYGFGELVFTEPYLADMNINNVIANNLAPYIPNPTPGADNYHGANVALLGDIDRDGQIEWAFTNSLTTGGNIYINGAGGLETLLTAGSGSIPELNASTKLQISAAGDFNGDGYRDILVGDPFADDTDSFSVTHPDSGKVYILSGNAPNSAGLEITGFYDAGLNAGMSLSSIGDFNGDGYSDIVIGAPNPSDVGHAYVLLGRAGGLSGSIDVSSLSPSQGFILNGAAGAGFGDEVVGIGDINSDGFDDFAVSSRLAGTVQVYLGNTAGAAGSSFMIGGITQVSGGGIPILGVGDLNGDGASDFLVGSGNEAHIFYGGGSFSNMTISGSDAVMVPVAGYTLISGGSAGDFNGDGFDDVALAYRSANSVDIYVVYGDTAGGVISPFPEEFVFHASLSLDGIQFDPSTFKISISSIGDQNGDGFDDVAIGLPTLFTNDGGLVIINGREDEDVDAIDPTYTAIQNIASSDFQNLIGTNAGNTMSDFDGTTLFEYITFNAGAGNDIINQFAQYQFHIDGGTGVDTLALLSGLDTDLRLYDESLKSIETIEFGAAGQNITMGIDDIFRLLQESESGVLRFESGALTGTTLSIDNNGDGSTSLSTAGFTNGGAAGGYNNWTFGGYTLMIDIDAAVTVTNVT